MNRRDVIMGAMGAAIAGSVPGKVAALAPQTGDDAALRRLLDALAKADDPEDAARSLTAFDPAALSDHARLDREAVLIGLREDAAIRKGWPFGIVGETPYLVSPVSGAWRRKDADAAAIDKETGQLRADAARGIGLPRPLLDQTVASIAETAAAASGPVADALQRQAAALSALRDRSPAEPGVWQLPQGDAYYARMLRRQCGGDITPARAHRMFRDEADRLSRRADTLLRGMGMDRGTVGDRFRALFQEPRWLYSDDDAGHDAAVADMNRWLDAARARLPALAGPVPGDIAAIRVLRMSPADEARGRSGYRRLPDGKEAGAYFVDLKEIRRRPSWTLPGVVHHELLPGHLAQAAFAADSPPHPLRERYAPGFSEGWAIYAERLMAADGAFADDPLSELGHLHWMLFRICRALVDTGVHYERWSFSTARETVAGLQGNAVAFTSPDKDMERICMAPGNRAAEALNWLCIARLGAAAGVRAPSFHASTMRKGPIPLALMAGDPAT